MYYEDSKVEALKKQLWSFTEAMAEAIDNRTPYNANHIRKVEKYSFLIAEHFNKLHEAGQEEEYFDRTRMETLRMSALLHDIGKMVTPTKVMNKATRLGDNLQDIRHRAWFIILGKKIDMLEGRISSETYELEREKVTEAVHLAEKVNIDGIDSDKTREALLEAFTINEDVEGRNIVLFTPEDRDYLFIEHGTLSEDERKLMENHVIMTSNILGKVAFNEEYAKVPVFAGMHHEYLDGSGYPLHLKGDEIPLEARILTAADTCDALLATDRPYKDPMSKEEAFQVMDDMVANGKLDAKIVRYLKEELSEPLK